MKEPDTQDTRLLWLDDRLALGRQDHPTVQHDEAVDATHGTIVLDDALTGALELGQGPALAAQIGFVREKSRLDAWLTIVFGAARSWKGEGPPVRTKGTDPRDTLSKLTHRFAIEDRLDLNGREDRLGRNEGVLPGRKERTDPHAVKDDQVELWRAVAVDVDCLAAEETEAIRELALQEDSNGMLAGSTLGGPMSDRVGLGPCDA